MNTNENEEVIVINLKDLAILFVQRLWIILLAAIIVGISCFAWLSYTYEEEYTSTAKVFLYYTDGVKSASAAASYLEVALYVVNDCEQFLTSRPVINEVLLELRQDFSLPSEQRALIMSMDYNTVKRSMNISNVADSRVLEVSVTTANHEVSKLLVDKICARGSSVIAEMLGFEQVRIFEEGTVSPNPSNSVSKTVPIIAAFLAGLAVYAVALVIKIGDNKINNAEDVEKYLGLSVLGEIPVIGSSRSKGKKYY